MIKLSPFLYVIYIHEEQDVSFLLFITFFFFNFKGHKVPGFTDFPTLQSQVRFTSIEKIMYIMYFFHLKKYFEKFQIHIFYGLFNFNSFFILSRKKNF